MVESSGPGIPRKCNTIALCDLGDTGGFGEPGVEDKVYALQLKDGVYVRKEVVFTPPPTVITPAFGNLIDVDLTDSTAHKRYDLVLKEDSKWVVVEPLTWALNFTLESPYVMTGKKHNVTKIMNKGSVLASLIPNKRRSVVISLLDPIKKGYMLTSRPAMRNVELQMVSEFNELGGYIQGLVPSGTVFYIEVLLGNAPTDFLYIFEEYIRLKWLKRHERQVCGIFIQKVDGTKFRQFTTLSGVQVQIPMVSFPLKIAFKLPYNIHFIKLMLSEKPLSETQLKALANEV